MVLIVSVPGHCLSFTYHWKFEDYSRFDSRIRNIVSKGPKYRFLSHIDFKNCSKEIASALNDFGNQCCKPENVECNALNERKLSIFNTVDKRLGLYYKNTNSFRTKP